MIPWTTLFNILSPGERDGILSVLIFHRVPDRKDPLLPDEPDAKTFRRMMTWLAEHFHVMPLSDAVEAHSSGRLPRRAVSITFDDGYADNYTVATPILADLGLHATFFVASGFLDGGCMWNDIVIESIRHVRNEIDLSDLTLGTYRVESETEKMAAIEVLLGRLKYLEFAEREGKVHAIAAAAGLDPPRNLMLSSKQLVQLRNAGMDVGAHTLTHPILARLSPGQARDEIEAGRQRLEEVLGERVRLFAYPNGKPGRDYLPEHVAMIRELGFDAAVSTSPGVWKGAGGAFEIPRYTPWRKSPIGFAAQLAHNMATANHAKTSN